MLAERPGARSMSRYAWMAPAVVLLALLLVYLFGDGEGERVQVLSEGADYQRLQIGDPDDMGALQATAPLSAATREHVLQNLSRFRAEYQMLGPSVALSAAPGSAKATELAERLRALLAQYNLGDFATQEGGGQPAVSADGLVLGVRPADRAIARELIAALAPMLAGSVTIGFDDTLPTGRMQLRVREVSGFTPQGVAVIGAAGR
ncbi:MAG: hypothetical protein CME38_06820 [Haliea sp.]|nr:hypothetical protein [Haliea sp.]